MDITEEVLDSGVKKGINRVVLNDYNRASEALKFLGRLKVCVDLISTLKTTGKN